MPVNWPTTGRTPGSAMEYVRQLKALTTFSSLFEFNANQIRVDNIVFKLHSTVTVLILLVGTMFVSMRQYFGEPIECMNGGRSDIQIATIQHYCWLEATFSVPGPKTEYAGVHHAYPGIKTQGPNDKKVYHKYYQWVYFVLIIQAILFYVPRYIWKAKEAKRIRTLISELKQQHILERNEYDRQRLVQDVADSLLISNDYFYHFFMCEVFYMIHLVCQVWFTNMFLGGAFLYLGLEWLSFAHASIDYRYDPLIRVFPRLTKCSFQKFGFSGTIETIDTLCFLPLNIVNEKIYVVLWFWFLFLFIVTGSYLVYRIVLMVLPAARYRRLQAMAPSTDKKCLKRLSSRAGNWFILQFLANNMKPSHFRDLIDEVMKAHFDQAGKPLYKSNKLGKAIQNGLSSVTPSAPKNSGKPDKKTKKFGDKKGGLDIGFNAPSAPNPGFVVKRDPPSGHSGDSDDWVGLGSGTEDPLNDNWP
ncbi:innexin inx2 [Tetranychus urticae]|uniref:Innexin n=1 Tax=Tetranychus urticae TaxID=32264 RepID=T1KKN2_TETUR|nr:innexin inx2 [Tetranychus urticae]